MYQNIIQDIHAVIQEIGEEHVQSYHALVSELQSVDVSRDRAFQTKYRNFWVMRYVSPESEFNHKYFRVLEENKSGGSIDFKTLCDMFRHTPSTVNGNIVFQFSFLTKLAHMVDPTFPIYDSKVSSFYCLPKMQGDDYDSKVQWSMPIVKYLAQEQSNALNDMSLESAIAVFRRELRAEQMSDQKILDSLIWGYVRMRERRVLSTLDTF